MILLTDGYLANGAEPWRIPDIEDLGEFEVKFHTQKEGFAPYTRDPETLARPWALPGTADLEHRIGGLEKADITGDVCYDPQNHEFMCKTRAEKVKRIARDIPEAEVHGAQSGKLLIVSWGCTHGSVAGMMRRNPEGVGWVHLRHINPFPSNLGDIISRFDNVVVPELNLGQLVRVIRDEYGVDAHAFDKIQGRPFTQAEMSEMIAKHIE